MKKFFVFALLLSPLAVAQDVSEQPPIQVPADTAAKLPEEDLLETWGWLLAEHYNLRSFNFNAMEMEQIATGMRSYVRGEEAPTDLRESMKQIQRYFTEREERMVQQTRRENKAKEQAFFDELMGLPGINSLGTGLHYQILEKGNETKPKESDTVVVRYEGRFLDNTVFDTTNGRPPAVFKLDEVIEGWTQGLQLIGEGGKIKLYVPAKLGYGDEPRPSIPPASTLVFEVELLKVGEPEAPGASSEGGDEAQQQAEPTPEASGDAAPAEQP